MFDLRIFTQLQSLARENATEQELDIFCRSLMNGIPASKPVKTSDFLSADELLATQAIHRVIKSAQFWELGRIRCELPSQVNGSGF